MALPAAVVVSMPCWWLVKVQVDAGGRPLLQPEETRLGTYTEAVDLRRVVWHGDVEPAGKCRFVAEPAELLMLTPGDARLPAGPGVGSVP